MELRYMEENALVRDEYSPVIKNHIIWLDMITGQMLYPDGDRVRLRENDVTVDEVLLMASPESEAITSTERTIFLIAGNKRINQPTREWFAPKEWELLSFQNERMLEAVYKRGKVTIIIKGTGTWFGEDMSFIEPMRWAYNDLQRVLKVSFPLFNGLRSTPASTGRNLLEMYLPENVKYPRLDNESCQFLRDKFGQGRVESFFKRKDTINIVHKIDGRLMYGSCMSHLPVGKCTRMYGVQDVMQYMVWRKDGKLAPLYPGFYLVRFVAPYNWQHIGLLPVLHKSGVTVYPTSLPYENSLSYCTADELALSIESGWKIDILEAWLWMETDSTTDALANWRKRIMQAYDAACNPLVKGAIRRIILHTLGSFVQFCDIKERHSTREEFIKLGMTGHRNLEKIKRSTAQEIVWLERVPLSPSRQKWVHPEWSRVAWGRARAKVARMALQIPIENIVGIMTDEIICADLPQEYLDMVAFQDTGKPGSFRLKDQIDGPVSWPENVLDLRLFLEECNKIRTK